MVKHRILLADDSVTIQKVVNLTFADEGIEVVAVGDGDAAMQKFVEAVPDLVMVDVNMPGVDGYHICEMIKQDDETKHIPVILLVGSFEPFDEDEARRVGADDFLTKPFQSIRQLVNKVSDLLNGKSGSLNDDKIAGSFEDTLEMPPPFEIKAANFGDAAMDDEMIQTDQIGSLPVNDAQKFQSVPESNRTAESDALDFETEAADEKSQEDLPEEVLSEIESPSEENRDEAASAEPTRNENEYAPRHENIYEFADEQERAAETGNLTEAAETQELENRQIEETETGENDLDFSEEIEEPETVVQENAVEETPTFQEEKDDAPTKYETTQEFELDDFDLLELPQSRKSKARKTNSREATPTAGNLSPEDIEAVADKVVEKISDKVIKRIVREVFTQMTKKK